MIKADRLNYCILFIIAGLFVFDLFLNQGEPATMDGRIHITSITGFAEALSQGQFPVVWFNNFANYGLPVGLFSHQIPLYLGAIIEMVTHNPVLSMNLITFVGILLTNLFFYYFLRLYVSPFSALIASILFSFAPYRILNVYIRGAMPETFSALFLPLILICLYWFFKKKNVYAFFLLLLSFSGLALTHPMMLVIYSFFIIPYGAYLAIAGDHHKIQLIIARVLLFGSALFLGLGLASYYLLPLFLEKKYFYFGASTNLLTDSFLRLQNFFGFQWYYAYENDIFTRGHVIQVGLPEMLIFFAGMLFVLFALTKKKNGAAFPLLVLSLIVGGVCLLLMTPFAHGIYPLVPILQNIQFPWRMMSLFIFIPPIIIALLAENMGKKWLVLSIVLLVVIFRFPQVYGKNYTLHPYTYYAGTIENLHSINMNTVWTGKTEEYPVRTKQFAIIDGDGKMIETKVNNISRHYVIDSSTQVRLVDYTFYFPGWKVFVDNQEIPIEFQDPDYRGVITYTVPPGHHTVQVTFTDTSVRKAAKMLSLIFIGFVLLIFFAKKLVVRFVRRYV